MGLAALAPAAEARSYQGGEEFLVGISVLKYDLHESGDSLTPNNDARTFLDMKLGYLLESGLYMGGVYSTFQRTVNGVDQKRLSYGGVLGYHADGFYLDLVCFLSSKLEYSSGQTFNDGTGYGADFGYNTMLGWNFYIGVEVSYKALVYNRVDPSTVATNKFSEFFPALNLGFLL